MLTHGEEVIVNPSLEEEVRSLILGERFAGEFQGVSYEAEICWSEDWSGLLPPVKS